ncbi:MAG: DinB family protein [Bacteroidota bacterium]
MKQLAQGCMMILMLFGTLAVAQEKSGMAKSALAGEFMANLADVEKKLVGLAEATPAEKYAWRPAEGVRSIGEVFAHLAGGNYFILSFAGVKPPTLDRDYEKKITEKAKIVEMMKASFAHVRKAAMEASDADLEKQTKMFGRDTNYRNVYLVIVTHAHEHLGQSIAYARMNGLTPPWSAGGE